VRPAASAFSQLTRYAQFASMNQQRSKERMTNSEAFVETLADHGVKDVFGIVGRAFMDALDLFPAAGIRFISVQHEQNSAHMADGYARALGHKKQGVVVGQNGPGVTNSVTAIAAAYYAHAPVVIITPEAATGTKGLGGFQECDTLSIFESCVKAQAHVHHPSRMSEQTARAFNLALSECGPTQLNIPRDYFYGEGDYAIYQPSVIERAAGGPGALDAAFAALKGAKNPVMICGGGAVISPGGVDAAAELAAHLGIPAAMTYLHNDAFPKSSPQWIGPIGYQGHRAAMRILSEADVVLAVGSRLNPFCLNPQFGEAYFPENATLIQVDIDTMVLGLTRRADVEVAGDAGLFCKEMLKRAQADTPDCVSNRADREANIKQHKDAWAAELDEWTHGVNEIHPHGDGRMKPREVLRALQENLPDNSIVATDIGNICSVANSYTSFDKPGQFLGPMSFGNCGYASPAVMGAKVARPDMFCISYSGEGAWGMQLMETLTCVRESIPITAVVFNNGQWGAEKKNQVLWFGDHYVGTNLVNPSFAGIAQSMGAEGIKIEDVKDIPAALKQAIENQNNGKTTILEMMVTRELGEPFRRDAMKLPKRHLDKYQAYVRTEESATGQPVDPIK